MARALRAWAINRGAKNSVRNLRYGPRTRLVRGIYFPLVIHNFDLSYVSLIAHVLTTGLFCALVVM